MDKLQEIKNLGEILLTKNPDKVPSFRIVRDILELPPTDPFYQERKNDLVNSKLVSEVIESQETNGTWGRFHSQDTKSEVKKRFPTTENAIKRALTLGFDKESEILQRSVNFIVNVLEERDSWSDPPEKHEGWPANVKLITAANLAKIDNHHPAINILWELWAEILERTFVSGKYNGADERNAHRILNGIVTKNKYPKLASIYPLILLSSTDNKLSKDLENRYLDWIWHKNDGIYYLTWFSLDKYPDLSVKEFPFWLEAIEILSGFDYLVKQHADKIIKWLWNQRNNNGLWDFKMGSESINGAKYCYFQISESWRNPINREIDCSVRILCLLKRLQVKSMMLTG